MFNGMVNKDIRICWGGVAVRDDRIPLPDQSGWRLFCQWLPCRKARYPRLQALHAGVKPTKFRHGSDMMGQ